MLCLPLKRKYHQDVLIAGLSSKTDTTLWFLPGTSSIHCLLLGVLEVEDSQGTGKVAVVSCCPCAAGLAGLVPGAGKNTGKKPENPLRISTPLLLSESWQREYCLILKKQKKDSIVFSYFNISFFVL